MDVACTLASPGGPAGRGQLRTSASTPCGSATSWKGSSSDVMRPTISIDMLLAKTLHVAGDYKPSSANLCSSGNLSYALHYRVEQEEVSMLGLSDEKPDMRDHGNA
jgi:hypothetical protein